MATNNYDGNTFLNKRDAAFNRKPTKAPMLPIGGLELFSTIITFRFGLGRAFYPYPATNNDDGNTYPSPNQRK